MTPAAARHSRRAGPALRTLAEADPALAALSLWCDHRDGEVTATCINCITYGPSFERLARHEQIGLAAHHILHVALRHSARLADLQTRLGGQFHSDLFNLIADGLVNDVLVLADHALPRPAVSLTDLLNQTLALDLSRTQTVAEWNIEKAYFALTTAQQSGESEKISAYMAAQAFRPDLDGSDKGTAPGVTAKDAAQWAQHLTRALDAGRQAGRGLGAMGHIIADVPAPQMPWEQLLRGVISSAVMQSAQTSHRRPARRWIATMAQAERAGTPTPAFQPGQRPTTDVPRIVVALDASGSIDDARLRLFWAEVTGIARRLRTDLHLLVFDDAVRSHQQIDPSEGRVPMPDLPRGGGTAFVPVIQKTTALHANPLVILTDLDGDPGPAPSGLAVFWVVPVDCAVKPPFGRLITMR